MLGTIDAICSAVPGEKGKELAWQHRPCGKSTFCTHKKFPRKVPQVKVLSFITRRRHLLQVEGGAERRRKTRKKSLGGRVQITLVACQRRQQDGKNIKWTCGRRLLNLGLWICPGVSWLKWLLVAKRLKWLKHSFLLLSLPPLH